LQVSISDPHVHDRDQLLVGRVHAALDHDMLRDFLCQTRPVRRSQHGEDDKGRELVRYDARPLRQRNELLPLMVTFVLPCASGSVLLCLG
jgi:hypothetical protein